MAISRCFLVLLLLIAMTWSGDAVSMMSKSRMCQRYPMGTHNKPRMGDNDYQIRVNEVGQYMMIHRFKPGRTYEVVLENSRPYVSFRDFYLTAVVDMPKKKMMKMNDSAETGNFVHVANPPMTSTMRGCPGVITTAYQGQMLDRVKLRWTAPNFARDCIMFKATVVKFPGVYFKDEGKLMYRVCPQYAYASDEGDPNDASQEEMIIAKPPSIKECCACGTATYKMKFQGKWIRQLHPRDWPENEAFAHWTNIIGATHNQDYFIYHYGGLASSGVSSVCHWGLADVLEGEFKNDAGSNILNIIKTRGIQGGQNLGESRTAIFAVNRTHHLMSMLTMLGPSPDWCTGISAQDLCKSDCTWVKNLTLDLYPWDAGINKGNTYMPERIEQEPRPKPIRRITPNWPPGNPFTVEKGKLRPVATVTIERLSPRKDYQCDKKPMAGVRKFKSPQNDDDEQFGRPGKSGKKMDGVKRLPPNLQSMVPTMCFMTPWSAWTPCSVTCGTGSMMRRRKIKRNLKPPLCDYVKLEDRRECMAAKRTCDYSKPCSATEWSSWSPCNGTCRNKGVVERSRTFIRGEEKEVCSKTMKTKEMMQCQIRCDDSLTCAAPLIEGFSCMAPVTRYYYSLKKKACLPFKYLGCKGSKNRFKSKEDCMRVCKNAFSAFSSFKFTRAAQLQEDETRKVKLARSGKSMRSCKQPMDMGHRCRHLKDRKNGIKGRKNRFKSYWYFDMKAKKCEKFKYKGCAGNDNKFATRTDCVTNCRKYMTGQRIITGPPVDCKVGEWGPWGPCQSKCVGKRRRNRRVIVHPQNGGRRCPPRTQLGKCPRRECSPCAYSAWSAWSKCSSTCGSGMKERTRTRLPTSPKDCTPPRPASIQRMYCKNKACPLNLFSYYRKHRQ